MAAAWKWTKEKARQAEYALKNKDDVQKRVLEATRDDDDQVTENEFLTIAHLTFDVPAMTSIRKTLWKRFIRIQTAPVCCRKALQILDYCVRYGNDQVRGLVMSGQSELQICANSHHFTSEKPREYMAEDQCRNLVQNLLAFVSNVSSYNQVRTNSEQQRQRVQSFYVQPLQVKLKPDSAMPSSGGYGGNTYQQDSYNNTAGSQSGGYNDSPSLYNDDNNDTKHEQQQQNQRGQTFNDFHSSSSEDEELDFDPREMSKAKQHPSPFNSAPSPQPPQNNSGGAFQQQQAGFNMFQQQQPQQQQPQSSPFQQQPQSSPFQQQPQSNPFQQPQQQPAQPNPFNQASPFNQQPNQFQQQPNQFQQQPNQFQQRPQQPPPQQFNSYNNSGYQQPPPSADDLLFGPSPTAQRQQPQQPPQQQVRQPQADPSFDGILDFSNIPMQPAGSQQNYGNQQQRSAGGGMLDEFGDLVNLDLQNKPQRAHGRPDNLQRGYNPNQQQQQQRPF